MEDQNEKSMGDKNQYVIGCDPYSKESVPGEIPALTEQEIFERKEQRIKEVAARVEINLNKPVR